MEVYYKPSDIVWVKLGPFWWPGEVVDKTKVPEDIVESIKKEPVAFVKFFDDDEYFECVKTSEHIYHYNCDRKNGFIKKGMDAFRANNPKMSTFPKDVSTAEIKTGGNANILSEPMFTPELKKSYGEILNSSSPKKPKNGNKNRPTKSAPIITHRRFLGYDDYEAHVLIQFPGKDKEFEGQEQPDSTPQIPYAKFTCPICHFVTDKLGILTIHTQSHVKDVVYIPASHSKKTPKRKKKKAFSGDEDSEETKKTKIKRKYKKKAKADQSSFADDECSASNTIEKDLLGAKVDNAMSMEKKDVCNDIIADWDDESNQGNTEEMDTSVLDSTIISEINTTTEITDVEISATKDSCSDSMFELTEGHKFQSTLIIEDKEQTECLETTENTIEKKKEKDANASCFDFDENEEDTRIPDATSGRKIPRVIPLSDKRKSFSLENDLIENEEEELRKKILNESVQLAKESETEKKDDDTEDLEKTYKSLMESTSKIELPDFPNILKSEQNFHCAKTVKYPDKDHDTISNSDNNIINLDVTQKVEMIKENVKHLQVTIESSPNIDKSSDESNFNIVNEDSIVQQLCHGVNKNTEEVLDICSIIGVKNFEPPEHAKIDNESVQSIKKINNDMQKQQKSGVQNEKIKKAGDVEDTSTMMSRGKRKLDMLIECPKNPPQLKQGKKTKHDEMDSNNETPRKRSKKSKVSVDANNSKNVENFPDNEISVNKQIEEISSDQLNDPVKVDQPKSENEILEDCDKNKLSKKEKNKKTKGKKEKSPVQKRQICESEIDKLLAKYSAEPIRDDEESDYCSSELVTEVLIESSSILKSESSEKDSSNKSDEVQQSISEREVETAQNRDLAISEGKDSIGSDIQNVTLEQDCLTNAAIDSNELKQKELKLEGSQLETIVPPEKIDSAENVKSIELVIDNQVDIMDESSTANLDSEICSEKIVSEVELKEETLKATTNAVSEEDKTSKRCSRRRKVSCEQQENISVISSDSKRNIGTSSLEESTFRNKQNEGDSQISASVDAAQESVIFGKVSTLAEQGTTEITTSSSTPNIESSSLLIPENKYRNSPKKSGRTSSKDAKKEYSESENLVSNKKGLDTSRRSTRRGRRSSSKHDLSSSQITTDLEPETEKIGDNSSKRDDSNDNEKEKISTDAHHLDTFSSTCKENSSDILKDIKKSEKNEKNEERCKTNSLHNLERISPNQKESHKSLHKSSKSHKTSSRSNRDSRSSRKNESSDNVTPDVDQIQEPVASHRSSRSRSHHTDQIIRKKDEKNSTANVQLEDKRSLDVKSLNIKSSKDDRAAHSSNKQKEVQTSLSQKEDRKSSHSSKSKRRTSKYDHEHHSESSMETAVTKNEQGKIEKKDVRPFHRRSKSDKSSNEMLDISNHNKGEYIDVAHGSSSRHNRRRSRDHSEKRSSSSKIENANEKDKTEKFCQLKTKVKRTSFSAEKEKIDEKHRNYRKERRSGDDYIQKKHKDSKSAESEKGDLHLKHQIDQNKINSSSKQDLESGGKEQVTGVSPIPLEQELSFHINQSKNEIKENKIVSTDEKLMKSETIFSQESDGKCLESNVESSSVKLEVIAKLSDLQEDTVVQEYSSNKDNIDEEKIDVSTEMNQPTSPENLFTSFSTEGNNLSNLISSIVGADSSQEFDQIKNSGGIHESLDPVCDSSSNETTSSNNVKEKTIKELDNKVNYIPNDDTQHSVTNKQEVSSQNSRRNRKPSRWDQKERPNTIIDKKSKIGGCNQKTEDHTSQQQSIISDVQKLDTTKDLESSNIPQPESKLALETEKLEEKSSQTDSSIVSQQEAEQIELIFGSSPLPKPQEDNLFTEEESEQVKEADINDFIQKKDPKKMFIMKSKLSEPISTFNEKNNDKVSAFECSGHASDDLMESVESQVARITHYEEPQMQESIDENPKRDEEQLKKETSFDTPEKKKSFSKSIFDTPDDKVKVDNETPENKLSVEKRKPRLLETDLGTQKPNVTKAIEQEKITPKSKKNYLLIDKSKLQIMEKTPETFVDTPMPQSSKSTKEKAKEVATKLTNPKKRFVKSFEDFELNKQREKSGDISPYDKDKIGKSSNASGLVGKSPIVFKLKKQFLSKISNVFDEESVEMTSPVKSKSSTSIKSVSPFKVKALNSSLTNAEETAVKDNIEYVPTIETETNNIITPVMPDDSPNVHSEVNVSESLSKDSQIKEELVVESLMKTETKTGQETDVQNISQDNLGSKHCEADNSSALEFTIETNTSNIGKPHSLSEVSISPSEMLTKYKGETNVDDSKTEIITKNFPLDNKKEEPEFVSIDGNLTVVSEKELEEGQVEITATMPKKKPINLMNFSMDFSDDSSDTTFEVLKKENIRCITESLDVAKTLEDEHKVVTADVKKPQQFTESTSKESSLHVLHDEESLHSAIIAQLDLHFDHNIVAEKGDDTNTTIENILETKLMKKDEAAEGMPLKDSSSHVTEMTMPIKTLHKTSDVNTTKTLNKIVDVNTTKELETAEAVTPAVAASAFLQRSERKAGQKPKLSTSVANEPLVIYNTVKSSTVTDMCDLEDHIPSQIVCSKDALINEEVMKVAGIGSDLAKESSLPKIEPPISKLLNRLTSDKTKDESPKAVVATIESKKPEIESKNQKIEAVAVKNLIKPLSKGQSTTALASVGVTNTKSGNKAIILSEKIIRPARDSVPPNLQLKRSYEDIEDIKPYIITKTPKIDNKKATEKPTTTTSKVAVASSTKSTLGTPSKLLLTNPGKQALEVPKFSGKAKILNQTIIRPAGEILQAKAVSIQEDNVEFDINSMPIVLSDELLTPESLENMPIVLGDNIAKTSHTEKIKLYIDKKDVHNTAKSSTNSATVPSLVQSTVLKTPQVKKSTVPKILQTAAQSQRIIRQASSTKPGKLIFVPENSSKTIQMKKPNIVRRSMPLSGVTANPQNITPETTGHKIMIVTNQQGQQQRLLLTPAHQKMFGMQLPKAGKTVMKSGVALKTPVGKAPANIVGNLTSSKVQSQGVSSSKFIKAPVSSGQLLSPQIKLAPTRKVQKVYMPNQQTTKVHTQKTILIKNQQGQTVRKIQGADEALLDKQVAEQLEAIKVSSLKSQQRQQELIIKTSVSKPAAIVNRKSYSKRPELKQTLSSQPKMTVQSTAIATTSSKASEQLIPALAPIKMDKKPEESQRLLHEVKQIENKPVDRPLNQLVIQDNMGNQTTVTEGQILALPSETVDGQPQSYMLVTLDESGNLTPLNNEALMSLDPSLAGGDLSNMVLQLDPGLTKDGGSHTAQLQAVAPPTNVQEKLKTDEINVPRIIQEVQPKPMEQIIQPIEQATTQVQVTCNINGEPSQQIILTGDPLATQKFLDSLSEGNTDLASILGNAEGSSFLIQADGQQILINTEPTDAQMLQANSLVAEQPDQGNPMFATHPVKNQDILAAALADTDVFQQEQISNQSKLMHSQLSPGQTLFPMNVGNVLETSLTLNSPIMTPLEVPSSNSKKIMDAESDILSARVPKNVDLPITITDPNISQTVSNQQVLMASDLQTNLELTLPISETAMSVTSGMNSPSFVYSLPNLGVAEHTEVSQKSFSSSMPLLTEDIEETPHSFHSAISKEVGDSDDSKLSVEVSTHGLDSIGEKRQIITSDGTFIEEGLCTLGGEMCSSLSEPPPEMFDIPISNDGLNFLNSKSENSCKGNLNTSVTLTPELLTDENSIEIPVQPQIVADLKDPPHTEDSCNSTNEKECKLD